MDKGVLTEVAGGGILLPDGTIVDTRPRDVIPVTNAVEKKVFEALDILARKYGIALVCQRCDHSIQGANNDSKPTHTIECRCRQWRFMV